MFKCVVVVFVVAASAVTTSILLITTLLILTEAKSILKRSTDLLRNPCGVILSNTVVTTNTPLVNTAADLITRTEDINDDVMELKTKMRNRISQQVVNHLDSANFTNKDTMDINPNTKQTFIDEPAGGMLNHYRQLYELITYIQHIRTHGVLSNRQSEQQLRDDLNSVETSIYSLICSLKIGLLNAGVETTNTNTFKPLSADFVKFDGDYTNEVYRAYVVIGDTERLIEYLNNMYTELRSQLSA